MLVCLMLSQGRQETGTLLRRDSLFNAAYQAFYGLKHYNLLEAGGFLIRKLNQSTSCLMLQLKSKNALKLPFI